MDMGQIASAVSSLKVAGDLAVGLVNLKTMAEVQAKAIELNQKIISAQHDIFAANATQSVLIERVRELEGQIAVMKAWDTEKQRYKLASPETGALVYALQRVMSNGEPPHYLCANCFKQGRPSILNDLPKAKERWHYWICPNCESASPTGYSGPCPPKYAEDIPSSQ